MTGMATRRPLILDACLDGILRNAGVDPEDLRDQVAATGSQQFTTVRGRVRLTPIGEGELPAMRGAITPCEDGDEITVFELDLGHGSSYRGTKRGSKQARSHILTPGRYPEIVVQTMAGKQLSSVLAHPWITDPEPTIHQPKKLADGLLLDIAPSWRTL